MFDARHALTAYWSARRIRTRAQLDAVHDARLNRWLHEVVPTVPIYRGFKDARLDDLPIIDKATLMADFSQFNSAGITNAQGWAAFAGDKMIGNLIVGASTGTSGNRGLFVISQAERFRWLGTMLAKALPGFWRERQRVAILLPLNTPLYDSANRMARLKLRYFDIGCDWQTDLTAFDPTVIVAPPKILRQMVEERLTVQPRHIFAAAETLDPLDRAVIEAHFDITLGQIYMATEGLMAVSCAHGNLHLCEDTMHVELPAIGDGLHEVIVSDFSRKVQVIARYRMNDLVRLGPSCPCGLPHRTLAEVVGRKDDCFEMDGVLLTPDTLRNAVVDADRTITDFRIIRTGAAEIDVLVNDGTDLDAVIRAVQDLLVKKRVRATVMARHAALEPDPGRKLRRVENRYRRCGS